MAKLTLEEMAAELGFCTKTLRKYVVKYKIPHVKLGRDMRFDSTEVWNFLKDHTIESMPGRPRTELKPARPSRRPSSIDAESFARYSKILGLE